MFSKKETKQDTHQVKQEQPIEFPVELPQDLPMLEPTAKPTSLNWSEPINKQEDIINDNARYNDDVNKLLTASSDHVEEQKKVLGAQLLTLPESLPDMKFDNPIVPDVDTSAVPLPPKERKFFNKLDSEHKKLRADLQKNMQHFTKSGFTRLLKQYDEKIESKIEQRQQEFAHESQRLSTQSKLLSDKQKELTELQKNLKELQLRLENKEKNLEASVRKHVEKQLINRSRKEKAMLRSELEKTMTFNKELKKKLDTITKDRQMLETLRTKLSEEHRKKLNALQSTYEQKLSDLTKERTEFEEKRKKAINLLHKAQLLQKEKEDLDRLKQIVEKKKEDVAHTLHEDVELKNAISQAELKLDQERANLDSMIFSKYIQWKLSDSQDKEKISDLLKDPKVDEINNMIVECRHKVLNADIPGAKRMYNDIKNKFEKYNIDDYNRSVLFNSLRELYSDIQICMLKPQ